MLNHEQQSCDFFCKLLLKRTTFVEHSFFYCIQDIKSLCLCAFTIKFKHMIKKRNNKHTMLYYFERKIRPSSTCLIMVFLPSSLFSMVFFFFINSIFLVLHVFAKAKNVHIWHYHHESGRQHSVFFSLCHRSRKNEINMKWWWKHTN